MQYTYWDFFSTAQNRFWTHKFWCFLVILQFLFHLFHISKTFPFQYFFSAGEIKKLLRVKSRVGLGGDAVFCQKLNTQHGVGRCAHKSPVMKWANALKETKKISLKLNTASHSTSWCTDTDGFLEHTPSRGSLYYKTIILFQKIILVFWCPPLYSIIKRHFKQLID